MTRPDPGASRARAIRGAPPARRVRLRLLRRGLRGFAPRPVLDTLRLVLFFLQCRFVPFQRALLRSPPALRLLLCSEGFSAALHGRLSSFAGLSALVAVATRSSETRRGFHCLAIITGGSDRLECPRPLPAASSDAGVRPRPPSHIVERPSSARLSTLYPDGRGAPDCRRVFFQRRSLTLSSCGSPHACPRLLPPGFFGRGCRRRDLSRRGHAAG